MSAAMFAKVKELNLRVEALERQVKQFNDDRAPKRAEPMPLGLPKKPQAA